MLVALTALSLAYWALIFVGIRASGLPASLGVEAMVPVDAVPAALAEVDMSPGFLASAFAEGSLGSRFEALAVELSRLVEEAAVPSRLGLSASATTLISLLTDLTPSVRFAISSARSASAWLRALPL